MAANGKKRHTKAKHSSPKQAFKGRLWLRRGLFSAAFLLIVGVSFAAYSHLIQTEHDLSVIGNGKPTVVQIHDPKFSMCQRLKSHLNAVKGGFKDQVQFRTANITTRQGREFAHDHNASTVTLLLFNERGRKVSEIEGVSSETDIENALNKLARR